MADLFEARADEHPSRACIIVADAENENAALTYAQQDALANRVAHWARARGIGHGHVVALLLENRLEYTALWLGLAKIGAAAALLNTQTRGRSLLAAIGAAWTR